MLRLIFVVILLILVTFFVIEARKYSLRRKEEASLEALRITARYPEVQHFC